MAKIPKVNESNVVVGETTISEARANGWPRRVARVFIFNRRGDVLLQKRSQQSSTFPGRWDCAGGHVDVGESYAEAAQREIGEELGIEAEVVELADPIHFDGTFYVVGKTVLDDDAVFNLKLDEVEEVRWVTVSELMDELSANQEHFTNWLFDAWDKYHDKLISKENDIRFI